VTVQGVLPALPWNVSAWETQFFAIKGNLYYFRQPPLPAGLRQHGLMCASDPLKPSRFDGFVGLSFGAQVEVSIVSSEAATFAMALPATAAGGATAAAAAAGAAGHELELGMEMRARSAEEAKEWVTSIGTAASAVLGNAPPPFIVPRRKNRRRPSIATAATGSPPPGHTLQNAV
jgi:hypothetical protein